MDNLEKILQDKKIFITGAGSIGTEIVRQLLNYDIHNIRVFDNSEIKLHELKQKFGEPIDSKREIGKIKYLFGDIRDKDRLKIAMRDIDIAFHTAAMKHVSICEQHPIDSVKSNVIGTQNVIDISIEENVGNFINISTDKATGPIGVMGATKLLSEKLTSTASHYKGNIKTIFSSVRFGNVIGSSGSVIPLFKTQIENKEPLKITDANMTRFMMSIEDAVRLIFKTLELAKGNEIFILKMPSVRILDLAEAMIKKYNYDLDYKIIGKFVGEKINETLITEEESELSYENNEFIVIPDNKLINHYLDAGFKKMNTGIISSESNRFLSENEIMELINHAT